MQMSRHSTTDPVRVARHLGLCAAALAGTAAFAPQAGAAVITFNTPVPIPNTFNGVYINFLTGATSSTSGLVPGWDFAPWGNGNTLAFFFPGTPANTSGAIAATTDGPYVDLSAGWVISAAATFSTNAGTAATAAFQSTGTHWLGFRFFNENTSIVNYGVMSIATTGPQGFPATITSWSFENTGGALAPLPIPEPATSALLTMGALALGAVRLRAMRRTRRDAP